MTALLFCVLVCNHIGPIRSKYRPVECEKIFGQCKKIAMVFLLIYALILYIVPQNNYLSVGLWVIILHSSQLVVAQYKRKEGV